MLVVQTAISLSCKLWGLSFSPLLFCYDFDGVALVVIVGSAITGPIGKECADLWPRIASAANAIV